MSAPKDENPNRQSEHLENLARMLREIEAQLSENAPGTCIYQPGKDETVKWIEPADGYTIAP
jgi:hypothetical protein